MEGSSAGLELASMRIDMKPFESTGGGPSHGTADDPVPERKHGDRYDIVQVYELARHILPEPVVKVQHPPLHGNMAHELLACPLREMVAFPEAEHLPGQLSHGRTWSYHEKSGNGQA